MLLEGGCVFGVLLLLLLLLPLPLNVCLRSCFCVW